MKKNAIDIIKKTQFKQQRLSCMIISELKIKEIIRKYQNKEPLSSNDYNNLTKFKNKSSELIQSAFDLKIAPKGSMALPDIFECLAIYFPFVSGATMIGLFVGVFLSEYKYDKVMDNPQNQETIKQLMDMTGTTNLDSLQHYLSQTSSNIDLVKAYDTLSQILTNANDVAISAFHNYLFASIAIGVAIPTLIIASAPVSQLISNSVDKMNKKFDNIKTNSILATQILTENSPESNNQIVISKK